MLRDRDRPGVKPGRSGAPGQRQLRVGEEVRHVLAGVFARGDFRDPGLAAAHLTVSEVRMSPDLRNATVFFARLGREDGAALLPALDRLGHHLRGELARALRLRVAPALHFIADAAPDAVARMERLLRSPEVARDLADQP